MDELVKKIGEIDLDRMIKTCEEEGWLNPIYVHDDSPKINQKDFIPDIMKEIEEEFESYNMRIMCLPPLTTLDYHVDPNNRINIPIITNDACFFIYDDELFKLPADGSVYLTKTTVLHTAINCSYLHRFHLIGFTDVD
tara:strand:- start:8585 stop:8998 length:414 start_codon:yes stop_codon:yes gene_type:complete